MIFGAEDDGYAVLEVAGRRVGRGLRPGRAGRPPQRRRPGRSQRRVADPLPLRPPAARPRGAAARPGRPRGADRLPDLAAPHRPGPGRAPGRRARRGGARRDRRRPGRRSSARCAGSAASRPRRRPSPGTPRRAVRDLHVQLAPHGLAHLAAPIHARFGDRSMAILHEDPYRLTEVDGVGFARADKIALAADVPPESSRRAQAAAVYALAEAEQQGTHATCRWPSSPAAPRSCSASIPTPTCSPRRRGLLARRRPRLPRADPRQRARRRRDAGRPRRRAPPPRPRARRAPPRRGHALTDEQWAAVRGAFAARISVLTGGPGVGKTVCTRAIVEEADGADAADRALRADRPRRAPARGGDRPRGADDPPHARVDARPRAGLQAGAPAARRPGDRRRVLDAQPAPDARSCSAASPSRPTSSSSATPTSCRRSAPASPSRT